MPKVIRIRRHSFKADTPTGLSDKGVHAAIKEGESQYRRTRYFASSATRAQNTAQFLSMRGKGTRKPKSVEVLGNIAMEAWPANTMEKVEEALRSRKEVDILKAWSKGRLKDEILDTLVGKEPLPTDKKYKRPPKYWPAYKPWNPRKVFLRDLAEYNKKKTELEAPLKGIPKMSAIGKSLVENAIIPNLPSQGFWRFFGRMVRPWKWRNRDPKAAEVLSHSWNVEAVVQYLTGVSFDQFPPGRNGEQMSNELEAITFQVNRFGKKIIMTYRGKSFDVTHQINALRS